ncbi:MAG: cupin domain-containing protein [Dehalococcoidales bacterium]|nr:cupin domain-containing protein [Dehalococcoidales bacterium]
MENEKKTDISLLGEAVEIAALVDYQSGSVVSRTIIQRDTGTVTIFAFDRGQGLSEHKAPFDALVHIIDGKAIITIDGQSTNLSSGEAIIMPANRPHALRAAEKFKMVLVMIKG